MQVKSIFSNLNNKQKIPGIHQDKSEENQARAEQFYEFLLAHPELGPHSRFAFSIYRDSMVSQVLQRKKANPAEEYTDILQALVDEILGSANPEAKDLLFQMTGSDLRETLKYS